MAEQEVDEPASEDEANEGGAALPKRDLMSLLGGGSLFGSTLLDPTQPLSSDPAAGTPAAGATDPNAGVASATQNATSLAQSAQHSDPGATAQNVGSDGSVSSATTPPPPEP
jgi:hypothetical protein